ncbi:ATP-binding cassette domain-containing protein [Leifsonia shinshuensis]|uniref:Peptide/nickel transport system ATP-binding protein n=1 Tax=Leifsonia shinshuensis TaxID=150026 RepID=A0A853CU18_9MICO|nr:ABC transporter ATP-binding protein [Leifsonia shinshuensis]NYJ22684.1 peptide/nickel transport system ATP-binding protein [Leifsonia shinshuensis]
MSDPIVDVTNLNIDYRIGGATRRVVSGVDLTIHAGESYGLVGESGSGKSTIALALTRYLPANATITADRLIVDDHNVPALDVAELRRYRAGSVGVVYQEPGLALNPTSSIGAQLAEVYRIAGSSRSAAWAAAADAAASVDLPEPDAILRRYPHELSGGQQQRAVIAMALATDPRLLILDEPTTGLDSKVEAGILDLIERLRRERRFATLLISHNLPLVATHCDSVAVLRQGTVVERAEARRLLTRPTHPYSRELVAALPSLDGRPGRERQESRTLLDLRSVTKDFGRKRALDGVSLTVAAGETLGVVGESGSGKSTLGRIAAGLTSHGGTRELHGPAGRIHVQMVFQNPDASLNPRRTVRQVLTRSIRLLGGDWESRTLADAVGLPSDVLDKLPRELSGGQKQRVAIARAFAGPVPLVVCDEVTSALDVSVQAHILDLLAELKDRTGVAYLFISHDLAVVRSLADRIIVLKDGRIVEEGRPDDLFTSPREEYTRELVGAATALRAALR